ncbi:phosphoenolpyruvate carboxykinase [Acrasis kona]|uniref:phosphoenolpyruvate carboxykinase (ATP) n=1 Tax=Acrasis kona TaxID=1008807 RepID=A0AAW2ZAS7_9EUKA
MLPSRSFVRRGLVPKLLKCQNHISKGQHRCYNPVAEHLEKQNSLAIPPLVEVKIPYWEIDSDNPHTGLEIDTNWSLAPHNIAPKFDAYRNPKLEHILKTAPYGRVKGQKYLVSDQYQPTFDRFVSNSTHQDSTPLTQTASKYFRRMQREVAYHLSYAYNLFVMDGIVGGPNAPIRFITDNSISALFVKNLFVEPSHVQAQKHVVKGVVFHGPGYRSTPKDVVEEFAGPTPKDLGVDNEHFLFLDEETNQVLLGGVSDTKVILESIVNVTGRLVSQQGGVLLPSDSYITKDGKVTLVINSGESLAQLDESKDGSLLYGAHHNVWNKNGLSRAWKGARYNVKDLKNVRDSDHIEKTQDGYVVTRANDVSQNDSVLPNIVNHPSNVVFAVNDPNFVVPSLAQLSVDQFVNLFNAGLVSTSKKDAKFSESLASSDNFSAFGHSGVQAKRLRSLLEESKAKLYVINTASERKDLDNALQSINNESKLTQGDAGKLWTELQGEGVKKQQSKNQEKRTSALKSLEDLVSKKVAALEPAPEEPVSEESGEPQIDIKQA